MAAAGKGKGFYGVVEDAYYSLLDKIDSAGIPVYKAVDAIEAGNIPSFPIALALLLLVIIGFGLWANSAFFSFSAVEVTVIDAASNAAIKGADVKASYGERTFEAVSGPDGKALLKLPLNTELEIRAEKKGFQASSLRSIVLSRAEESKTISLKAEVATLRKTISFLAAGTTRLFDRPIEAMFSCSENDFAQSHAVDSGTVELDVPSDCGALLVRTSGGYSVTNDEISFSSDKKFEFFVEQAQGARGGAVVSVVGQGGQSVAGVDVTLYAAGSEGEAGTAFETKQTSASGTVAFSSVPSGRYYAATYDRTGTYGEYDGLAENVVQEVLGNSITSFSVALTQSSAGKVRVLVKDKATSEPLAGASIRLSKGKTEITSKPTDSEGRAEFNVGEDVEYSVLVDKPGYLIKTVKIRTSPDYSQVLVEEATAENSQSLLVNVVDENNKPVENAKLKLRSTAENAQVGQELVTGLDGRAVFERVSEGVYQVYAVKPGYGDRTGDPFTVSNRQQNIQSIKIPIGSGRLLVSVVDLEGKPVAGASVKAVDFPAFQVLEEAITDSDAVKEFSLRADKRVFLVVGAEGYLATTTAPIQMQRDVTLEKKAVLYSNAQSLSLEFASLSLADDGSGAQISETLLNPAQKYTATLRLIVPRNATFDEAGIHVRTGREQSNSLEKDFLYISEARAAYSSLAKGTSYNPPLGQAADAQHLGSGSAKFVNIAFKKVSGGVYEAEADIIVRDEAKIGSLLEVWYRGYGKSGGYLRVPSDAVLGNSESTAQKQGLYANALKRTYSVGPTSLCGDDFCSSYSVEDLRGGITSSVVESYTGQVGGKYRLLFEITGISKAPFSASQLLIKDKTSSISVESYKVRTALGEERTGLKSGSEVLAAVGDIGKDAVVSGEAVFEAKKEGTIPIEVSIVSGSSTQSEVYRKTIFLKVLAAKKLGVDILPKVIVPLINNNILVRVTDGNSETPVSNARVSVKKDGTVIASGETDIEGVFPYTLLSASDGSVVGFAVEKAGFRPSEKEIRVSGNILLASPELLKVSLTVGGKEYKTLDATIVNYSQVGVEIEKVAPSRDFEGYADFKFNGLEGELVAPDGNIELSGTVAIGPTRGSAISQPTRINGAIIIHLTNPSFSQRWVASIPVELTLGFGDEVDDPECLSVFPDEWKLFSSTKETKQFTLSVVNNCRVGGEKVSLRNISMRVVPGSDNQLGVFRATGSFDGSKAIQLEKPFRGLVESLPGGAEGSVKLEFRPDEIVSGKAQTRIEVQGSHFTSTGEQKLVKAIKVEASVNNLGECVEVLTNREIVVNSCPYNTGFGNYSGRFSQYSNSRYSQFDPYAMRNGYGTGIPPYIGTQSPQNNILGDSYYDYRNTQNPFFMTSHSGSYYPNASYAQPFYNYPGAGVGEGINPSLSSAWSCGSGSFQVRNNCSSAVDLSFDAQQGVNVKDKTVKVETGEETQVTVEPTNFFGRYALSLKAKPSESPQKSADIRTLYVNVTNEFTKNYKDCISVNPSRTLSFNNFIGKPVELQIINSCYDQGVVLDESPGTIMFSGTSIATPTNSASGFREMIESWSLIQPEVIPQPNGRVKQVLTFEVIKALKEYRNRAPKADVFGPNKFKDIGNLRYFLTSGYYAVEGRTNLVVRFTTQSGFERTTYFPMIIQDYWPLLEFAEQLQDQFVTYGNPKLLPSGCINGDALNFAKLGELPVGKYSTAENGKLFKIDEQNGCGTADHISEPFNPNIFEKNGLKMIVAHDGHEATISFDDSQWNGTKTQFNESMISKVTRVSPPGTQIQKFTVSFIAKAGQKKGSGGKTGAGDEPVEGQPYAFECTNGEAGDAPYFKYGFQHLKFDWRIPSGGNNGIARDACDALRPDGKGRELREAGGSQPLFCDAVQASLAIVQKIEETKKITDILNTKNGVGECSEGAGFTCSSDDNKRASELFRFVLTQSKSEAYFLGKDNKALDLAASANLSADERIAQVRETIAALRASSPRAIRDTDTDAAKAEARSANLAIMENTQKALDSLALATVKGNENRLSGAEVVLEVDTSKESGLETMLKNRGLAINNQQIGRNLYIIGLSDYRAMNWEILDKTKKGDPNCNDKSCRLESGVTITAAFTAGLAVNGTWKLSARNAPEMGALVEELVSKDGNWVIGAEQTRAKYNRSLLQFHRANIGPSMLLVKDTYENSLMEKLSERYGGTFIEPRIMDTKIEFQAQNKANEDSGDYNVVIDYSWAGKPAVVSFALARNLQKMDEDNRAKGFASEYAKNILLSMPIDGKIATGTGFSGLNSDKLHFSDYGLRDPVQIAQENPTASKQGTGTPVDVSYLSNYDDTRDGRIVSIAPNRISYTPSDPIRVDMTVSKGQKQAPAGALFEFFSSLGGISRLQNFTSTWVVKSGGLGMNEGTGVPTESKSASELCGTRVDNSERAYPGIIIAGDDSTSSSTPLILRSIVYTPASTDRAAPSYLTVKCAKDSGSSVQSFDLLGNASLSIPGAKQGDRVELSRRSKDAYRTEYNLKALLSRVRGSSKENAAVCIKAGANSLDLYWNDSYFLK